jgi:hypothetical protein
MHTHDRHSFHVLHFETRIKIVEINMTIYYVSMNYMFVISLHFLILDVCFQFSLPELCMREHIIVIMHYIFQLMEV